MPFPGVGFIILAGGITTAAASALRRRAERRRARRELARHPALGTSMPEGTVVRVTGTVRALDPPLTAPLSGRPCVLYRSTALPSVVWSFRKPRAFEGDAIGIRRFIVEAEGGPVLIDTKHVVLDLEPLRRLKITRERREQFRLRLGMPALNRFLRLEECIVAPGSTVSVVGLMMLDPAVEPPSDERGFRDAPAAQRRLTGNAEHPVVVGLLPRSQPAEHRLHQ